MKYLPPLLILCFLGLPGCGRAGGVDAGLEQLRRSLTFYASFDVTLEADYASGDATLYRAPSANRREEMEPVSAPDEHFQIVSGEGVYRDALMIDSGYEPIYFYIADDNVAYERENWSGTVSFWMRLSPDEDLREGYSDPIQVTARGWNDSAIFVDFTNVIPREFRFAIFPDRDVWDPERRDWDDVPVEERPMVDVPQHPFSRDEWTHVAISFYNFNTGEANGIARCYLNGEFVGALEDRDQTHTWAPGEGVIWLGYNYRGMFDELSIFDRALSDDEVRRLYELEDGVRQLL